MRAISVEGLDQNKVFNVMEYLKVYFTQKGMNAHISVMRTPTELTMGSQEELSYCLKDDISDIEDIADAYNQDLIQGFKDIGCDVLILNHYCYLQWMIASVGVRTEPLEEDGYGVKIPYGICIPDDIIYCETDAFYDSIESNIVNRDKVTLYGDLLSKQRHDKEKRLTSVDTGLIEEAYYNNAEKINLIKLVDVNYKGAIRDYFLHADFARDLYYSGSIRRELHLLYDMSVIEPGLFNYRSGYQLPVVCTGIYAKYLALQKTIGGYTLWK